MAVNATLSDDGSQLTIDVDGRFDFSVHQDFRRAYKDQPASLHYRVNLTRASYMDSSALGMLLLLRDHAGGDNHSVELAVKSAPEIERVLTIANFDRMFKLV